MVQRVAYGALALTVLCLLFVADILIAEQFEATEGPIGDLLGRGNILPLLFLFVMLRGAVELGRLLRAKGARPHTPFAYLMIVILLLTPWLSAAGWLGSGVVEQEGLYWPIVWVIVAVVGAGALTVIRGHPEGTFRDVGATLTMIFYLGFLSSFGLQLRCGQDIPGDQGAWLLLIAILVTKASDIGAYFAGSVLGRHKLAPSISPAKSIEGTVGGLLASAAVAVLFVKAGALLGTLQVHPNRFDLIKLVQEATLSFGAENGSVNTSPVWRALLFGLAMSAAGQLGDLIESCFKRDACIKDSGKLIPRYGGILDLVDSPVVAMPVAWFLLTAVWNVV